MTVTPRDIVVTWPKRTKSLAAYLDELARARHEGLVINFRVANPPRWPDLHEDHEASGFDYGIPRPRCFMVYDGFVRGWLEVLWVCERRAGEVAGWPAGWYIVRDPEWHLIDPLVPMSGFQGWRWMKRTDEREERDGTV